MFFLYNIVVQIVAFLLPIIGFFNKKIQLFVKGRTTVFTTLQDKIPNKSKTIWFHAASLGEYEQGLPIMQKIKQEYPNHIIVVSFFSPSGYQVRKNNTVADITVYLPLDTPNNAKRFIAAVAPEIVFFIKYEYWPNYLKELKKQNITTYLISGIFRENQVFFKWYGGFYRKALQSISYFFVQNEESKKLLQTIGFSNVMVSGDTRFDRVIGIANQNNKLPYIANFKNNTTTIVIGSSWAKDEQLWIEYINQSDFKIKFIIAPHNIKTEQIKLLQNAITRKSILFSEKENQDLAKFQVFIIDTVGLLTKIYSYANIAYVGGGFGKPGVHNVLEPAVFGIPILIGPNYVNFAEATALVQKAGSISVNNTTTLTTALNKLLHNDKEQEKIGAIAATFVQDNQGATTKIINYVKNKVL